MWKRVHMRIELTSAKHVTFCNGKMLREHGTLSTMERLIIQDVGLMCTRHILTVCSKDPEYRLRLVRFVHGSVSLPTRLTLTLKDDEQDNRMVAHTCFDSLDVFIAFPKKAMLPHGHIWTRTNAEAQPVADTARRLLEGAKMLQGSNMLLSIADRQHMRSIVGPNLANVVIETAHGNYTPANVRLTPEYKQFSEKLLNMLMSI